MKIIERLSEFGLDELVEKTLYHLCRFSFTSEHRKRFYEALAFGLENGKKLSDALIFIRKVHTDFDKKWHPFQLLCDAFLESLADNSNNSFEMVLADWVPLEEAALISAGLNSDQTVASLKQAVKLVESRQEISQVVLKISGYPLVFVSLVIGLIYITTTKVVPTLSQLSDTSNWTGSLLGVKLLADFTHNYGVLTLLVLAALIGAIIYSVPRWTGRLRNVADRFMPWSVYKDIQGAVFIMNMASLLKANIKTIDALYLLHDFSSPWLQEKISDTVSWVRQGNSLGAALMESGHKFPSREAVSQLVLLSEGDGGSELIGNFGEHWLKQTIKKVNKQANMIMLVSLLMLACLFLVLISVVADIQNVVNSSI